MGPSPGGGAYTYDWIENLLRLNVHSADHILPEFQHLEVGDAFGDGQNNRNRFRLPKLKDKIGMIPMEPGSVLMEHKMLHGVKRRAERLAQHQAAEAIEH
jgi:hypothetical protein